ncbi:MAG: S41 family peptidase [Pseudomonadales bacterium]
MSVAPGMLRHLRQLYVAGVFAAASLGASAAPAADSSDDLDARLVARALELLDSYYVEPDKVDGVRARLEAGVTSGRYAGLGADELVERLNEDLLAATSDKHVYVRHDPRAYDALIEDEDENENENDDGDAARAAYFAELARTSNHGLVEMKVLPGNVRYLEIRTFFWDDALSPAAYESAMRFLAGGDALIIDLRRNGGGSMQAVNHLASHFLEPGTELMTFDMGPEGVQESVVERVPPAGRIDDKPLFVLVSGRTGSAAEEASMHFKHFGLATLVGTTSAGAGNRNGIFPLLEGFTLSVSTGRAIHAVTGTGWEGSGVAPDVETPVEDALVTAQRLALETLIERFPAERYPARAEAYRKELAELEADD